MEKSDGKAETDMGMEEEEVPNDVVGVSSGCNTFVAGGIFTVGEHYVSKDEEGKSYVTTSISQASTESMACETGGPSGEVYGNPQLDQR